MELLHDSSIEGLQKCANMRTVIISAICLLAGVGIVVYSLEMANSTLSSVTLLAGCIIAIVAIYYLCFHSTHWIYKPTGSEARKISLNHEAKRIIKLWDEIGDEFGFKPLNSRADQSEIRVDCVYTRDKKYAAVQLCQYSSFLYTPLTEIHHLKDEQAARFIERIRELE